MNSGPLIVPPIPTSTKEALFLNSPGLWATTLYVRSCSMSSKILKGRWVLSEQDNRDVDLPHMSFIHYNLKMDLESTKTCSTYDG